MNLTELVNSKEVTIVDVRTIPEFAGGSVENAINIPLDQVPQRVDELKAMQPMVMCCAAGVRSGQAVNYLNQLGLDKIYNGGSWQQVDQMLKKP